MIELNSAMIDTQQPSPITPEQLVAQQPLLEQQVPAQKSLPLVFIGVLGLLLVTSGSAVFFAYQNMQLQKMIVENSQQTEQSLTDLSSTSPMMSDQVTQGDSLVVKKADELWLVSGDSQKQLTQTNGGVMSYTSSKNSPWVAFIQGQKLSNGTGYVYIRPEKVVVLNTQTNEQLEALSYPLGKPAGENTEFEDKLVAVQFSHDGNTVAITTSQSLYLYEIPSKKLTEIFTVPYDIQSGGGGIFGYSSPQFSPKDTKVILVKQFYEGHSYILVDLQSKKVKDLPFESGYGGAQLVLGWLNDDQVFVSDSREDEIGKASYPDFKIVDVASKKEQALIADSQLNPVSSVASLIQASAYIIRTRLDRTTFMRTYSLELLDLETNKTTFIADLLTTEEDKEMIGRIHSITDTSVTFTVISYVTSSSVPTESVESVRTVVFPQ